MTSPATFIQHDPLNAEPEPKELVRAGFLTPQSLLYHRNHGEYLDVQDHRVAFEWDTKRFDLDMTQLRALEDHKVVAALQCAGNRRSEMSARLKETEGIQWQSGVIGNAEWQGPLLRGLLLLLGISEDFKDDPELAKAHVEFVSAQPVTDDTCYAASIELATAMDASLPILLATHVNGEPLSQAHGGPVRVVVPAHIGARSVKWLTQVVVRRDESPNFYQQRDYKVLPPDVGPEEKAEALLSARPLQHFSTSSVISEPTQGTSVGSRFTVKGYAVSGKRSQIAKVEVAVVTDCNEAAIIAEAQASWHAAALEGTEHPFAWVLFEVELDAPAEAFALVCRAECLDGTRQVMQAQWNLRGVDECSYSIVRHLERQ